MEPVERFVSVVAVVALLVFAAIPIVRLAKKFGWPKVLMVAAVIVMVFFWWATRVP